MEYKHFSHSHTLTLHQVEAGQNFHCSGCDTLCKDSILACWKCNFFLHNHCGNANRYTNHPSHPPHPLTLMPNPTYCSGSFLCNACGAPGSSFSYCCAICEVDLHLHCAFLPAAVSHHAHHHELRLHYSSTPDYCRICAKQMDAKHWSYLCGRADCGFRVHTMCGTGEVTYQDDPTRVRSDLTPEEEMILEMGRLQLEFQMAQGLAHIIAST